MGPQKRTKYTVCRADCQSTPTGARVVSEKVYVHKRTLKDWIYSQIAGEAHFWLSKRGVRATEVPTYNSRLEKEPSYA